MSSNILLIDNYDSFTYNIVQLLMVIGKTPLVVTNNQYSISELEKIEFSHLILSPGPGHPSDAGITLDAIKRFTLQNVPTLGICLGHQALALSFGGSVRKANEVRHGKISNIENNGKGIFKGLPVNFNVTRYHSLIVDEQLPKELELTSWNNSSDGSLEVMGLQHKTLPCFGVQFHPEAILSEYGKELLENFFKL